MAVPARGCNCGVCPLYRDNAAAAEPICSGCNTDCAYCGCARAGGGAGCGRCPVRCGSRTDIAAWLADVGGTLRFTGLEALARVRISADLPAFVPQVHGYVGELDAELGWPAYAIGLRRVFSWRTATLYPAFVAGVPARATLGLRPGQLAVLAGYADDPLVEAFWTRRRQLIPALARQRWDLVLAPNYSMYGKAALLQQMQAPFERGEGVSRGLQHLAEQRCHADLADSTPAMLDIAFVTDARSLCLLQGRGGPRGGGAAAG